MSWRDAVSVPVSTLITMGASSGSGDGVALQRAYQPWSEADSEQLVEALRQGLSDEEIAVACQRSVDGVRSRMALMVPIGPEYPTVRGQRLAWLREQILTDPGYDWRTPLRVNQPGAWTLEVDAALAQAWQQRTPLVTLVEATNRSESILRNRLIHLGLARDTIDVVERLGCAPAGPLAAQYAVMLDRQAHSLHVLAGVDTSGQVAHLSLHVDDDGVQEAIDKVEADGMALQWAADRREIESPHREKAPKPRPHRPLSEAGRLLAAQVHELVLESAAALEESRAAAGSVRSSSSASGEEPHPAGRSLMAAAVAARAGLDPLPYVRLARQQGATWSDLDAAMERSPGMTQAAFAELVPEPTAPTTSTPSS